MTWKSELTVIVPFKLDSVDRLENLMNVMFYFRTITDNRVVLVECDTQPRVQQLLQHLPWIRYCFIGTESAAFWSRSLAINTGAAWSSTELVAPWDIDIVVKPQIVEETAREILENRADVAVPYSAVHFISHAKTREVRTGKFPFACSGPDYLGSIVNEDQFGGCNVFRRSTFRHIRGFSERFVGWGHEDMEMGIRVKTLGLRLFRHPGEAWHLDHERTPTSQGHGHTIVRNTAERDRVERMTAEEVRAYYGIPAELPAYLNPS